MHSHPAFDVFLSHSSLDKGIVRTIAERLRSDGLRVWFDDWEIRLGDNIPSKIEEGLDRSRVLVLCMSVNAFAADWAMLESQTFRFRDPLNRDRRFIPLRLDESPIRGSLAQYRYLNWMLPNREQEYPKLLEACRPPAAQPLWFAPTEETRISVQLEYKPRVLECAFSPDRKHVICAGRGGQLQMFDAETGRGGHAFYGHTGDVTCVAWSADKRLLLSGGEDGLVRAWDSEHNRLLCVLSGHDGPVTGVAWDAGSEQALSCSVDGTIRVWNVRSGRCAFEINADPGAFSRIAWSADRRHALSASQDGTLRLWDTDQRRCLRVMEGHIGSISSLTWTSDGRLALTGSNDNTIRVWEVEAGICSLVLKGHTGTVLTVAYHPNRRYALSGATDRTVRVWDAQTGFCLRILEHHEAAVCSVIWADNVRDALSVDQSGVLRFWELPHLIEHSVPVTAPKGSIPPLEQVQYTNAKVLLVGATAAGKTGLSMRLALSTWRPTDSTVGAWATQWLLPVSSHEGIQREIWLWDFGGQADQRLIHQLYMEDTALAVLVFDGQKDDVLETLAQWDRDLTRASRKTFTKILTAGRVDTGGLRISRGELETFAADHGFVRYFETSAKTGTGCEELKAAILAGIRWDDIPWHSSPLLFKHLKDAIILLKDEGRVLMRFNELRDTLRLRLDGRDASFEDSELKAVLGLLAGPGILWELAFGSLILLQPAFINAYAQAVIQAMRGDADERGSIEEARVLSGQLTYLSSVPRLRDPDDERFVLLAMVQTLVERGLCLREHTETGPVLIFPSYYRKERPELVGHPSVLVTYRFSGFLDDIYATLVVRLHHTKPFERDQLWRYAADFKTLTGKKLGFKLIRLPSGLRELGELQLFFDPEIPVQDKILFSRYIHEHVSQKAREVVRIRDYICQRCGTQVGNRDVARKRLATWMTSTRLTKRLKVPTIICANCEKRVPLWDEFEASFASLEIVKRVRELQEQSSSILRYEGKQRALVGEVIATVALSGQIIREAKASKSGSEMEIEFTDDAGRPTGRKLFLLVRSQEHHDLSDISAGERMVYPVMLVSRIGTGAVWWIKVEDWPKEPEAARGRSVINLARDGELLDVMSVRRWRQELLVEK